MPQKLDFATLSLRDALDLAILIEDEARERYLEFADQMDIHHTPEAAGFFRAMADNEAKHGQELSKRREAAFPGRPRVVKRSMQWDVEAPDYDTARAFMSARQAMEVALASEVKAYEFFESALPCIEDAEVRALFEELREEEREHQDLVQARLAKLPAGAREQHAADHEVSRRDRLEDVLAGSRRSTARWPASRRRGTGGGAAKCRG